MVTLRELELLKLTPKTIQKVREYLYKRDYNPTTKHLEVIEPNRIYNENCLDTMSRMSDNYLDLTVTSPPYDSTRSYSTNVGDIWNDGIWKPIIRELYRVIKVGGVVVWVVGDATLNGSETGTSFEQALYFKQFFNLYDTMIYGKNNPIPKNHPRYEQQFEYMFIFSKGKPNTVNLLREPSKYAGQLQTGTMRNSGGDELKKKHGVGKRYKKDKVLGNVWFFNVGYNHSTQDDIAFKHPAIFPEKLAEQHIHSWTNEGDLVYDPFAGSGTTLKMAKQMNRNWIGSELSSEYCEIIKSRL